MTVDLHHQGWAQSLRRGRGGASQAGLRPWCAEAGKTQLGPTWSLQLGHQRLPGCPLAELLNPEPGTGDHLPDPEASFPPASSSMRTGLGVPVSGVGSQGDKALLVPPQGDTVAKASPEVPAPPGPAIWADPKHRLAVSGWAEATAR